MNTREEHLRNELRTTEAKLADTRSLLNREPVSASKRAQLQAMIDVLERRHQVLHHLLRESCVKEFFNPETFHLSHGLKGQRLGTSRLDQTVGRLD